MVKGLETIHNSHVAHLDLKETNILIVKNEENKFRKEAGCVDVAFKIADFGIAKQFEKKT